MSVTADDEVVLLGDILGGSPLTNAMNTLAEKGLLAHTIAFGGMNLPMAMTAMMGLATMDLDSLKQMMLQEGKNGMSELVVPTDDADDEDDEPQDTIPQALGRGVFGMFKCASAQIFVMERGLRGKTPGDKERENA